MIIMANYAFSEEKKYMCHRVDAMSHIHEPKQFFWRLIIQNTGRTHEII